MNSDSAVTQAIGVVVLSGAIILTGTNLQVQPQELPGYFAQKIDYPVSSLPEYSITGAVTRVMMPTLSPDTVALESIRSDFRWHKYVAQRIEDLRAAKYDFTDLKIPPRFVVDRAWGVAATLFKADTPTPSVVPSEDGNVLFVWHKSRWDLEIEVGAEEIVLWAHDRRTGTGFSGSLVEQQARLSSLLDYLARH
jgi:hypothetical protein